MRVLLTNDDGIDAEGLRALRRELLKLEGIDLLVVAPDGNRSATARSITTRRPLWVSEVAFEDGQIGYAIDGTPVDCVRLANLQLVPGWEPEIVVSGINHGSNLGDDITYSGTVAAALEGVLLGLPSVAVSQQSTALEFDYRLSDGFDFSVSAPLAARIVGELDRVPASPGTLLNINVPGRPVTGIVTVPLGKRRYIDALDLIENDGPTRRRFRVYGQPDDGQAREQPDTDIGVIAAGKIALTPLHFDLTDHSGVQALTAHKLDHLLADLVA